MSRGGGVMAARGFHHRLLGPDGAVISAQCAPGTPAFFGAISDAPFPGTGLTNVTPSQWNAAALEPQPPGILPRLVWVVPGQVSSTDDEAAVGTLRHEIGHTVGFDHEEIAFNPDLANESCNEPSPRSIVPPDPNSVMTTPECNGGSDGYHLTDSDRLSAFLLYHTARTRFELRGAGVGYRYGAGGGTGGAEILWHGPAATAGEVWTPTVGPMGIEFIPTPTPYFVGAVPADWFPTDNDVVIPARLSGNESAFDLLFHGPGPDSDFAGINTAGTFETIGWLSDAFVVPLVGAFDALDLGTDQIYLYAPGPVPDSAIRYVEGVGIEQMEAVPQMDGYAYPIVAPFRGTNFPDDIIWLDPLIGQLTTWLTGPTALDVSVSTIAQTDAGLSGGELVPAIGDFNGDDRADIMWHGVAALPAFADIEDVLWISQSTPEAIGFVELGKSVGNSFRPFVGDFDGDGVDDIFWQRSWELTSDGPSETETGPSYLWYFDPSGGGHVAESFVLSGDYSPYVGDFDADGCHDIAWFDSVGDSVSVWRCIPGQRDFECGPTIATQPDTAPVGVHWGF